MTRRAGRGRLRGLTVAGLLVAGMAIAPGVVAAAPAVSGAPLPTISPAPQSIRTVSQPVRLSSSVHLVVGTRTDPAALTALRAVLQDAGVRTVTSDNTPETGVLDVYLSGASDAVLRRFGVTGPAGLPSGGYVLVVGSIAGQQAVVLDGVDATGTFYAVQTLRQLVAQRGQGDSIAGIAVRDWPSFPVRGGMESFYGNPWSQADALHQIDFLGAHKMNALLYTATGDPRTTGNLWRSPYPPQQLASFAELVERARSQHVDFMYRIDPETIDDPKDGICHSSPSDLAALVARYQQLWSIGIHTISVGWDDDAGTFVCAADTAKFGSDPSPEAAAQASVVTYVYQHFVATHPGARLVTVPSQYAGDVSTVYRTRLAALTPAAVQLFWTGPKVVSPTITLSDLNQASAAFGGRRLLIFDNYPVNDYVPNEEHLGPLVGRDPNLAGPAAGIMANEMREEEPSLISLFTIADYAWNAKAYDPLTSWSRSLAEFGGAGVGPLRGYAENSVNSWINTGPLSPVQPLIRDFVNAYTAGQSLAGPAARLTAALGAAAQAPAGIRAMVHDPAFVTESAPWLTKLADQANAGLAAVAGLLAQARGDHQTALTDLSRMNTFVAAGKAIPQYVAQGVYETLTTFASNEI